MHLNQHLLPTPQLRLPLLQHARLLLLPAFAPLCECCRERRLNEASRGRREQPFLPSLFQELVEPRLPAPGEVALAEAAHLVRVRVG